MKSKTFATWLAVVGGGLGLHRFYLHGARDLWGWLHPLPAVLGLYGIARMQRYGLDDRLSWALIPLLGASLAVGMLMAIIYGLTNDDKWNLRYNADSPASHSGWGAVLGVIVALMLGAWVLMATLAFSGQRYFELQVEQDRQSRQ